MKILLQKLWPEIRPFKGRLSIVLFLGVLISGLKSMVPTLMKTLQDEGWQGGNHEIALYYPLAMAGIWLAVSFLRYFHLYWMKYVANIITVNFRRQLMNKYLQMNISFFQGFETGSGGLISRMLNDVQIIQEGIYKISDLFREPFLVVFCIGYILYLDWKLFVFILVGMPLIAAISKRLSRSLRKYGHKSQESVEDLAKTLKESLDGARIVQSFNLQDFMRERFNKQADHFLEMQRKIISREEAAGPLAETIFVTTIAGIFVYLGQQIFNGTLNTGDIFGFITAVGLLSDAGRKIQYGYVKTQQAVVALERLHKVLDHSDTQQVLENPTPFPENWQTIEYRNVSFQFPGGDMVLKNINLTVKRGEMIALVGASGSGKSTIVNLLERFYQPTMGNIYIDGIEINNFDLSEYRNHVALVSQDVFLFGDTIEKNILAGDFSKPIDRVEKAAQMANAHNFIIQSENGYLSKAGDQGSLWSGGEKQRISIARAILKDAPILILDEATSALDSESEKEVQKGLNHLMQGRTTFVVAHRLSTVANADRILVMQKGEIIEQGNHQHLLTQEGTYRRLYNLQTQ